MPEPHPGVDFARVFAALPTPYLVMSPDLVIVDANPAYLAVAGRRREELVGRPVFEAFPPTPDALDASGVSRVQVSFERARDTGRPDVMPLEKYDIADPGTGELVERFWSLISVPVLDDDGRTLLVMQRTEDVTDFVRAREQGHAWERRVADAEADLYARAKELAAARETEALATQRLAALADVALRLAQAETPEDLAAVIFEHGLAALGADGGGVAVRGPDEVLHLAITPSLGPQAQLEYATLPLDGPLPASISARTGERFLLPDEQACLPYPELRPVIEQTGCVAWACLPLRTRGRLLGSLSVGWRSAHAFPADEVEVLDVLAAQCAYGLDRIQARQAERTAAQAAQRMSSALQRALLTEPPQPDDLSIVVRYRPAAHQAQVGGDWYDAFVTAAGTTTVVVGDVAGHDRDAAAVMGQLRNVLRGLAYVVAEPPAAVLTKLDRALHDLDVGSLATAVLATVLTPEEGDPPGARRLRWTNAGHPPPLLVEPDGSVRLLHTEPDLLLGLDPGACRTDHEVVLQEGATLLLYTDGLVERRRASLDDGLAWLQQTVARIGAGDLDRLCDALLDEVGEGGDDDVAMLALHAGRRRVS